LTKFEVFSEKIVSKTVSDRVCNNKLACVFSVCNGAETLDLITAMVALPMLLALNVLVALPSIEPIIVATADDKPPEGP
jgi:hypothetical protein